MKKARRKFLRSTGHFVVGATFLPLWTSCNKTNSSGEKSTNAESKMTSNQNTPKEMFFKISLAQWSLHKALGFGEEKTMDNLDFAKTTRGFGIDGVEYVNQFFKDKATDQNYLKEMIKRADDNGVENLLIMIDGEGGLASTDTKELNKAVENHYKWVDAAKTLGCHSIRVNSFGEGSRTDVAKAAVQGLGALSEYANKVGINVIVENHGGYSSDGAWLSGVMKEISLPNCGTLPDFGNFCVERDSGKPWGGNCINEYDRYKGVEELMPFAKAVSAKSNDFNDAGDEIHTDFKKMMKIVKDAGYTGYVGIEYEGSELSEKEGILATKKLLEQVGKELS